ncbi:tRNA lysidine(34) synthetase TilS [Flavobacteriaceae bacterium AU392]|nr:tRNA lysidine(34) synthetase TilS [Flavobacteriaceae bacterium]RKM86568.1 tRNA lysidine(34) synthetase TilS [Flavobacteriaceae bacterium AU392]
MLDQFKNHINQNLSFLTDSKLLIAISGGMDSVMLTHLCYQLKLNIVLAHCNFNLRGDESDKDESFVIEFAEDIGIEVFVQNFDTITYAKENKLSIQMAARELRYDWFNDLVEQLEFDYILTAHHADDNLETFLINLSRGTGLEGLTGIPVVNENIVRPLLPFSRKDINKYLEFNKLTYREDSSNSSTKYLRNKLRHEVLPVLKEINPQLLESFNKTQNHLKDSLEIINDRIDTISNKVIDVISEKEIHFNIEKIKKLDHSKAYLYELLKGFNFTEWNDIYHLLQAQSGKQVYSSTHRLLKDREVLILTKKDINEKQIIYIKEKEKEIVTPLGILFIDNVDAVLEKNSNNIVYLDADKFKYPLILRQWKDGDYFYPAGMQGKKKLSKYFKDEKLSLVEKENTWLLCSEEDIIWIIGRRLDNRFKATKTTTNCKKITFKNAYN